MEIQQRQSGSVAFVDVDGRLVLGFEDRLKDCVNSLLFQGHRNIVLNLRGVTQVDTSGLATITSVRGTAEKHAGRIKLLNLPKRVHDLLIITRLITLFEVFDSEENAVRSFDQPPNA